MCVAYEGSVDFQIGASAAFPKSPHGESIRQESLQKEGYALSHRDKPRQTKAVGTSQPLLQENMAFTPIWSRFAASKVKWRICSSCTLYYHRVVLRCTQPIPFSLQRQRQSVLQKVIASCSLAESCHSEAKSNPLAYVLLSELDTFSDSLNINASSTLYKVTNLMSLVAFAFLAPSLIATNLSQK